MLPILQLYFILSTFAWGASAIFALLAWSAGKLRLARWLGITSGIFLLITIWIAATQIK